MGENGAKHKQLSEPLIKELKKEMQELGLKNPGVIVVYDREGGAFIGYPPDIDACECTEVKDVERRQPEEVSSSCCLANGVWVKGIYIPPYCYNWGVPC